MRRSYLHLTTDRHLFNYDESTYSLAQQPSDFLALKKVCITLHSEMSLFKKKSWIRRCFVIEKAKVELTLLPKVLEDWNQLLLAGFIFQQDGAPAHTARIAQKWLQVNCREFIRKDESLASNFAGPKPRGLPWLGCDVRGLSQAPYITQVKAELKEALQVIWDSLSQELIN